MPDSNLIRCLILACVNTLRGDDGVGPWIAEWAEERFHDEPGIRVISRQQWTPELAEDIAGARAVIFIDCSVASCSAAKVPGSVELAPVEPAEENPGLPTHHLGAPELLVLARSLFGCSPREAMLLTVGAGSMELSEEFSDAVTAALPSACRQLEEAVLRLLVND